MPEKQTLDRARRDCEALACFAARHEARKDRYRGSRGACVPSEIRRAAANGLAALACRFEGRRHQGTCKSVRCRSQGRAHAESKIARKPNVTSIGPTLMDAKRAEAP